MCLGDNILDALPAAVRDDIGAHVENGDLKGNMAQHLSP